MIRTQTILTSHPHLHVFQRGVPLPWFASPRVASEREQTRRDEKEKERDSSLKRDGLWHEFLGNETPQGRFERKIENNERNPPYIYGAKTALGWWFEVSVHPANVESFSSFIISSTSQ